MGIPKAPNDRERCLTVVRDEAARVLGLESLDSGDDDTDLFSLGLMSLTAVELVSSLRHKLGVPVGVRTLFDAPTVSALAALVEASGKPI
ncbi:acyl carrier protein [Amycolatopsis umgeniensis]|uniref:Aryl carrier-like protein n=1 Tax=Amycolatopsis umgeniensis TaxID=336628 RepID=A0A841AXG2_9PSEU|nr:acyl carrier protein [Amycolatopsis umgeniensis]MBB5851065.1 aryl carrier-like protein [Amycolatopsis umgeniensis]